MCVETVKTNQQILTSLPAIDASRYERRGSAAVVEKDMPEGEFKGKF